ncbi:MAG: F0F1 ATP synthase subunit epsilon [Phycisphaerae bacterium]
MPISNTFQCSVITPERKVLECDATFVSFPAHDGEMGVLTRRAPLVCKLGIGLLRVETLDPNRDREGAASAREGPYRGREGAAKAKQRVLFIDGGFAQVLHNRLTILTEQTREATDLDAGAAKQALVEARAIKITDDASYTVRSNAMKRARIQLKLAESGN